MLIFPLRMLGMWIGEGQRATASGERIFQVIDEPEEIRDEPGARELPAGPGRVRFEGVTFGYDPARPVFDGLDLELEPGRTVALIGHTGSGKTTLASLIPRFYDVQAGRVTIDGADVREVTLNSLRREIGAIAQDPFLFSATVRENLAFGRADATDEQVEHAARLAQAHEFIERLPEGYDTVIGERGITLSGGQRQRVAIARALVVDPRILILDDATASVDATTEAKIRLGLREAMRGRTTVIIAHRLSTIALADEIVVLDHGRVAARGTHDDLVGDQRGLPRDLGARPARAGGRRGAGGGVAVRVWQPGSHLVSQREVKVQDWSWAQTKRRLTTLYRLARPYRLRTALAIVFLLGATAASLVPPLLIGLAVNEVSKGQTDGLPWIVGAFVGAGLVGLGCSYGQTYFTGWTGERMLADLRNHLFRHLQRLSLGFYERNRAGALVSRITNDVEALDQLVTDGVTSLVQNTLTLVGTAVILFFLDWRLALATLTVVPLLGARHGGLPQALVAQLPPRAREARPGHGDARRGHRRHARAPGVHARARRARELPRGEPALPRRQPGDGRPERRLLPLRRPALVDRDRDRARLRRLPGLRREHDDRRPDRVPRLPDELLRPGAAALAALQHVPLGRGRAGQDHGRARGGARR